MQLKFKPENNTYEVEWPELSKYLKREFQKNRAWRQVPSLKGDPAIDLHLPVLQPGADVKKIKVTLSVHPGKALDQCTFNLQDDDGDDPVAPLVHPHPPAFFEVYPRSYKLVVQGGATSVFTKKFAAWSNPTEIVVNVEQPAKPSVEVHPDLTPAPMLRCSQASWAARRWWLPSSTHTPHGFLSSSKPPRVSSFLRKTSW